MKSLIIISLAVFTFFSCKKDEPLNTTCSTTANIDYKSQLLGTYRACDSVLDVYTDNSESFLIRSNAYNYDSIKYTMDSTFVYRYSNLIASGGNYSVSETEIYGNSSSIEYLLRGDLLFLDYSPKCSSCNNTYLVYKKLK